MMTTRVARLLFLKLISAVVACLSGLAGGTSSRSEVALAADRLGMQRSFGSLAGRLTD